MKKYIKSVDYANQNSKKISNYMNNLGLSKYKKGVEKSQQEDALPYSENDQSTIVDPSNIVEIPTQKNRVKQVKKYSLSDVKSTFSNSENTTIVDDFITKSKYLDAELNSILVEFNIHDTNDFTANINPRDVLLTGGKLNQQEKADLKAIKDEIIALNLSADDQIFISKMIYNTNRKILDQLSEAEYERNKDKVNDALAYSKLLYDLINLSNHPNNFLKHYNKNNINTIDRLQREAVLYVVENYADPSTFYNALVSNGYIIKNRNRATGDNNFGTISHFNGDQLKDLFLGQQTNVDYDYKNDPTKRKTSKLFPLAQKLKQCSTLLTKIQSIAAPLIKSSFRGIDETKIHDIKELYENIADKVYIVTSNTFSLDLIVNDFKKEFVKLYKSIITSIDNYVPPSTSGSGMIKIHHTPKLQTVNNDFFFTPKSNVKTDKLYFL